MSEKEQQQYHFYGATAFCWVTGDSVSEVMKKLKSYTKDCMRGGKIANVTYMLVKVPLPQSATYEISGYMPQVEGAEVIDQAEFGK